MCVCGHVRSRLGERRAARSAVVGLLQGSGGAAAAGPARVEDGKAAPKGR